MYLGGANMRTITLTIDMQFDASNDELWEESIREYLTNNYSVDDLFDYIVSVEINDMPRV